MCVKGSCGKALSVSAVLFLFLTSGAIVTPMNHHQLDLWRHRCDSAPLLTEGLLGSLEARTGSQAHAAWGCTGVAPPLPGRPIPETLSLSTSKCWHLT